MNVDDWLIDAYKPTTTPLSQTQIKGSSSIKDMTQIPLPEELNPLNDKLKISLGTANSKGNKPDFEYYEVVSKNTTPYTRKWEPPVYVEDNFDLKPETGSESATATGTGSNTNRNQSTAQTNARNAAISAAEKNALTALNAKLGTGWKIDGTVTYKTLNEDFEYDTSWLIVTYHTYNYTVKVEASASIKKEGTETLYVQADGTGQWGEPVKGKTESVSQKAEIDELRVYSGNSLTITCTDPAYEITKVRVHFSGSNQINQQGLTTYLARFIDSEIELPQEGDETSHLFGMEYNDADKWQQWSGIGKQTITLNLADYVVTSEFNLGGLLGGEWLTYEYEYRAASRNLDYYLIVDRIDVKCTEIKEPEEESTE